MPTTPDDLIALTQLPRELRDAACLLEAEQAALAKVRYKALYGQVLDGTLPAERISGRWFVRRKALPEISLALGLTPAKASASQKRHSRNAAIAA